MSNPNDKRQPSAPRDRMAAATGSAAAPAARRVSSDQLFGSATEVEIDHRGVTYRLRRTSLGKLILTK